MITILVITGYFLIGLITGGLVGRYIVKDVKNNPKNYSAGQESGAVGWAIASMLLWPVAWFVTLCVVIHWVFTSEAVAGVVRKVFTGTTEKI